MKTVLYVFTLFYLVYLRTAKPPSPSIPKVVGSKCGPNIGSRLTASKTKRQQILKVQFSLVLQYEIGMGFVPFDVLNQLDRLAPL